MGTFVIFPNINTNFLVTDPNTNPSFFVTDPNTNPPAGRDTSLGMPINIGSVYYRYFGDCALRAAFTGDEDKVDAGGYGFAAQVAAVPSDLAANGATAEE